LTHTHYRLFLPSGSKILKMAWAALPKETQALASAALAAPDLDAVSLGKERMFAASEAIVWAAALGTEFAARVAAVARPMTNPNNIKPVISRVPAGSVQD
jgi:hypothetical protein